MTVDGRQRIEFADGLTTRVIERSNTLATRFASASLSKLTFTLVPYLLKYHVQNNILATVQHRFPGPPKPGAEHLPLPIQARRPVKSRRKNSKRQSS